MSHFRATLRSDLRAALAAAEAFEGFKEYRAYPEDVNWRDFPFFAVRTPQERVRPDGCDTYERVTEVRVHLRRCGGDGLEDALDGDAETVEALVLSVLDAAGHDASLDLLQIDILSGGERRLGQLDMHFRVTRYTGVHS